MRPACDVNVSIGGDVCFSVTLFGVSAAIRHIQAVALAFNTSSLWYAATFPSSPSYVTGKSDVSHRLRLHLGVTGPHAGLRQALTARH